METTFLDPILKMAEDAEVARAAQAQKAPDALGREDFLRLLVTQLQHQDPFKPVKDTEFVAQLATFSSLEQLITANDKLEGLAFGQANLVNAQALNLIGKQALVESGGQVEIRHGAADRLVYALPKPAAEATLTILDASGKPVRTLHLDPEATSRTVLDWDGADDDGRPLPDGVYTLRISANDTGGSPMGVALFRALPIDGVNFAGGTITLVSGDREIPFETIMEIRAEGS